MNVIIDGVIFQLQAGHPRGISRVWHHLIPELQCAMPRDNFIILRRGNFSSGIPHVQETTIPLYRMGPPPYLDADDRMLAQVCATLKADIFLSTYYSRVPGLCNLLMIYDMIPEALGFDLNQPEWLSKRRAIENADQFICISHSTRNDLVRYCHMDPSRAVTAHCGVAPVFRPAPLAQIDDVRQGYGIDSPYFVLAGNRGLYKNCTAFFQAFSRMPEREHFQILAFGGEQQLLPAEQPYARDCRFTAVPWLEDTDMATVYSGAVALVYPSRYEGFGLPVAEAMACGCPVITTRQASLPEVGGDAVFYIDPDSPEEMIKALKRILQPDVRVEMTVKGLTQAKRFSWASMAGKVRETLMGCHTREPLNSRSLSTKAATEEISIPVHNPAASSQDLGNVSGHTPQVSAIVSTYNAERFMRGCLEDLTAQTLYARGQLEIVVVDSASPQNEKMIVEEYRNQYPNIVYLRTPNRETMYAAWNRAIRIARGKYITNANTDDRHTPVAMEKMAGLLDSSPETGVVYADSAVTCRENMPFSLAPVIGCFKWPEFDRQLLFQACYIGPHPMWRKSLHDQYGYFDQDMRSAGDYEFWLRISDKTGFHHLKEILGLYLDSPASIEHQSGKLAAREAEDARCHYWHVEDGPRPMPRVSGFMERFAPLVSVILTTCDRQEQLQRALDSIAMQVYPHVEIIVVNDGETDVAPLLTEFGKRRPVLYIRQEPNRGPGAARNLGLKHAHGDFVAYLDDDGWYCPDHIHVLATALQNNPECAAAYSPATEIAVSGEGNKSVRSVKSDQEFSRNIMLVRKYIPILSLMHRKDLVKKIGGFEEQHDAMEDWDFTIRLALNGPFVFQPKATAAYEVRHRDLSAPDIPTLRQVNIMRVIYERYAKYASPEVRQAQEALLAHFVGAIRKRRMEETAHASDSGLWGQRAKGGQHQSEIQATIAS